MPSKNTSNKKHSLKIGLLLDDSLDHNDGVQQYVRLLGRWLNTQGHEVHYLVNNTKREDLANVHNLSKAVKLKFNGNTVRTPLPASNQKIRALLEELKLDVIHVQMPYSPFMAGKVLRLASNETVIVGTFHILPYKFKEKIATKILKIVLFRSLKKINSVMSVSTGAQQYLAKSWKIQTEVVPNIVDVELFKKSKPTFAQTKPTIVFLGRLVERKGVKELIEACYELKFTIGNFNWRLIIAGDGPMKKTMQKKCRDMGLDDQIKFIGRVAEDQKADLLRSADVAVFPSLGGESFGIVLIEAMASGSHVVIAGNNPGYSSVMADVSEVLFDPKDKFEFASTLEKSLNDIAYKKNIHAKQQHLVKIFDVNLVGQKILSYYYRANS